MGQGQLLREQREEVDLPLAHATKVSFNRPFHRREWRFWDIDVLRFLEREGYDVSYVSDTDVDANPQILQQHRAVIVSGHAEYWTKNQRNGFDAARDAGTNLFFAGANDAYWQVRYEDSSCADDNTVCGTVGDRRTMVIYKEEGNDGEDPNTDPSLETIQWRDLGSPECELQGGVQYGSWFPNDGYRDYTTTAAGAADPWAAGSGLSNGSTVSGLVGFEYDSFFPSCAVPGTPQILFAYQGPETSAQYDSAAVKYTANGSGARVFSSGTEQWAWGLDSYRWDPTLFTGIPPTNPAIQQYTRNLLADMARPAPPASVTATASGGSVQIDTTPRGDPRITSYKVYRHAGTGAFQPGDAGVTLVCQNATGDCTDTPAAGTYRYASVAVDQWNDSGAALSSAVTTTNAVTAVNDSATLTEDAAATAINVLANDTRAARRRRSPPHPAGQRQRGDHRRRHRPDLPAERELLRQPDSFTYTINGGSTATVSVTVNCVDDPPVAVNDTKTVTEDSGPALLTNRDFEVDTSGWGSWNAPISRSTAEQHGGAASMRVDLNGTAWAQAYTNPYTAADPNTAYTVGMWVKAPLGYHYSFGAVAIDASNAYISTFIGPAETGTGTWQHVTASGTTPPGTASIAVYIADPSGVAQTIYVDDVNLQTAAPTPIDVLANDNDGGDGGPNQIDSVTQPAHGTVTVAGDNKSLSYQPNAELLQRRQPHRQLHLHPERRLHRDRGGDRQLRRRHPPVAVNDTKTVTEDSGPALLTNRDFEVDTSGWASWNASISRSTAEQHGGAASMRVDFNGTAWAQAFTNPYTAAAPNTAYTVGMWVKAPLGYHYSFGAVAIDASNAYISTFIGQAETGTGTWQHVTASGTTPPGTASIAVYIADPSGVAQTIYVDDVNLQTAAPTPIDVLANDNDGGDGGPSRSPRSPSRPTAP